MKRAIDLLFATLLSLCLLPFLGLLIVIILLLEGRSPFFIQERLGKGRTMFRIYKFRSMIDGEITPVGRILRKLGIDELPQLLNILKGDMSFVGPRPLTAADVARLGWLSTYYDLRWTQRPGITGLAQLGSKCHKKMTWLHDSYYVKNFSLCLDFKLMILSVFIPLLGKNRVKSLIHKNHTP